MLSKLVMILDKRKELPTKYKKNIETSGVNVFVSSDFEKGLELLTEYEPDLVLVSDSLSLPLSEAVKKLRMLSYPTRPCIVAVSKSSEQQDKLDVLDSGADDFLSEPIESEEFKARINAHLRRHYENMISEITHLPDIKFCLKVLKRTLLKNVNWAGLLIKIENFEAYRDIYGDLAGDKMLQAYSAIIQSSLEDDDFIGQLNDGEFLILTKPIKAERIASFLVYAFDAIVEKFYTEDDAQSGYIILQGDDDAGKKVDLVSTSIGVVSSEFQKYTTVTNVLSSLFNSCKLAKTNTKSSYMVERAKIGAENAVINSPFNNKILIVEPDDALNYLLKTTADMQGYESLAVDNYDIVEKSIKSFNPAVIILDAGIADKMDGLELCKKIKLNPISKDMKVVLSTVVHDKKMVLNAGADLYIPKPYELLGLFNWIENLIQEYNS